MSKFTTLVNAANEPKAVTGTAVYSAARHDYGLAAEDSRNTGIEHISVTLDPNGGYPVFTIPLNQLQRES
jgi:hypothetical protein